jgi:hypothetical protein
MRNYGLYSFAVIAAFAIGAQAELNIIGDVIIQNPQPGQVQVAPGQQPQRGISVPKPIGSESTIAEEIDDTPKPDAITLLNDDVLHGALMAIAPSGTGVSWKHPNAKAVIDFDVKSIDGIELGDRSSVDAAAGSAEVQLTNGDILTGSLKALTADALKLSTWYAGDMNIKRVMITRIRPNSALSDVIYQGPTDIAKWTHKNTQSQPSWQYKDGGLYAIQSNPIGRQIPGMPDKARIEFNVAWRGYPQFYFSFFSDNVQQYSGNCYLLQVSGQSVYMQRYSSNSGSQNLGNANVERFQQPTIKSAKFTLLVDKPERKIVLLIDDEIVRQWTDPNPFGGLGNGILFQPQTQGNLKVSDISVRAWDGKMPAAEDDVELDEDRIAFINNDKVSGQIQTITDGQVTFATEYATLDVPVTRIAEIGFSPERAQRARRNKHDILASFKGSGQITLNLDSINAGTLSGKSENFGDVKLPMRAFSGIEFNIYKTRAAKQNDLDFD